YRTFTLKDYQSQLQIEQQTQSIMQPGSTPAMKSRYPIELIMEGRLIPENLREANMGPEVIEKAIRNKGCSISDVFYAVKGTDGKLYLDFYPDRLSKPLDL
ncbi:YetF domain-containing protein, partial [Paenibacillus sp. GCM10023252]|uniref:YetF domain-containing protein n=1 Tax=Paenibacillus sp. GCM10023252 TaxID=3252649 RepID=UPI00361C7BD7